MIEAISMKLLSAIHFNPFCHDNTNNDNLKTTTIEKIIPKRRRFIFMTLSSSTRETATILSKISKRMTMNTTTTTTMRTTKTSLYHHNDPTNHTTTTTTTQQQLQQVQQQQPSDMIMNRKRPWSKQQQQQQQSSFSLPKEVRRVLSVLLFVIVLLQIQVCTSDDTSSSSTANNDNNDDCLMQLRLFDNNDDCQAAALAAVTNTGTFDDSSSSNSALGGISANGQCNAAISYSKTPTYDSFYDLPGYYIAICTEYGRSIRFLQSGCKHNDCNTTYTSSFDPTICQQDLTEVARVYSGNSENRDYNIIPSMNNIVFDDMNSNYSKTSSCHSITDGGGLNATFLIIGDCNQQGCYRDYELNPATISTRSPTPAPVPTTSVPTTTNDGAAPTTSSTVTRFDNVSTFLVFVGITTDDGSTTTTTTNTNSNTDDGTNNNNNNSNIILNEGIVLSSTAIEALQSVTSNHIQGRAIYAGYNSGTIITAKIQRQQQEQIIIINYQQPSTNTTAKSSSNSTRKKNFIRYLQSTTETAETSGTTVRSLKVFFDIYVNIPADTNNNNNNNKVISAAELVNIAFDESAERESFVSDLTNTNELIYQSVTDVIVNDGIALSTTDSSNVVPTSPSNNNNPGSSIVVPQPDSTDDNNNKTLFMMMGIVVTAVLVLGFVGYYIYSRGIQDALNYAMKQNEDGGTFSNGGNISPNSSNNNHLSPREQQQQQQQWELQQQQLQQQQNWTNEIIIDPSRDDVSTLGGNSTDLQHFKKGTMMNHQNNNQCDTITKVDEDEYTASVNVDYDFVNQRYRTGAHNEDATIDDANTKGTRSIVTRNTAYTDYTKLGMALQDHHHNPHLNNSNNIYADDDQSFDQQYVNDHDEEEVVVEQDHDDHEIMNMNMKHNNNKNKQKNMSKKIATNANNNNTNNNNTTTITAQLNDGTLVDMNQYHTYEIQVPPGLLGMVVDTPPLTITVRDIRSGHIRSVTQHVPMVRAIKSTSVLFGNVQMNDQLIQVDHMNVTNHTAIEISQYISSKVNEPIRTFVFRRPI